MNPSVPLSIYMTRINEDSVSTLPFALITDIVYYFDLHLILSCILSGSESENINVF